MNLNHEWTRIVISEGRALRMSVKRFLTTETRGRDVSSVAAGVDRGGRVVGLTTEGKNNPIRNDEVMRERAPSSRK